MTRNDHRAQCIEAGSAAMQAYATRCLMWSYEEAFTTAFDSLHGIARVNPIEATEKMIEAGNNCDLVTDVWRGMSVRGDLTTPPEKKP